MITQCVLDCGYHFKDTVNHSITVNVERILLHTLFSQVNPAKFLLMSNNYFKIKWRMHFQFMLNYLLWKKEIGNSSSIMLILQILKTLTMKTKSCD